MKLWKEISFCLFLCNLLSNVALEVTIYHNGDTDHIYSNFIFNYNECSQKFQLVHDYLQHHSSIQSKNGNFFSSIGMHLTDCHHIESSIFYVPQNELFIWPSFELGHQVKVPDIIVPGVHESVHLITISTTPRLFLVENLLSLSESKILIEYMSNKSTDEEGLETSLIGEGVTSLKRTSSNGWDSESTTAIELKGRCMELLRAYQADESWFEEIQIARYLPTQYFDLHHDFFESNRRNTYDDQLGNLEKDSTGSNRFATVLFYLVDVPLGGETIFPLVSKWWDDSIHSVVSSDRDGAQNSIPREPNSLAIQSLCHHSEINHYLHFTPKKLQALLFYSQSPSHQLDRLSLHGACPVLQGIKWIATVWMWNGPRSISKEDEMKVKSPIRGHHHEKSASVVVMFSLSPQLQEITAPIRLLDPQHEIFGIFNGKKPFIVNSKVGEIWIVELLIDSQTNETFILDEILIKPTSISGKLQHYVISLEE